MASSEARRQKKLQKKKAKRQQKHSVVAQRTSNDPGVVLRDVENWPIHDIRVPSTLWKSGMGNLFIARWSPQRTLVMAVFLLDTYYLGVKNAFWTTCSPARYTGMVQKAGVTSKASMQKVDPAYFVKLINEMVKWSKEKTNSLPHPDFRHASKLLAGIDPSSCDAIFEFGLNGKPMYNSGPDEVLSADEIQEFEENGEHYMGQVDGDYLVDGSQVVDDDYVVEGQVVKVWDKE